MADDIPWSRRLVVCCDGTWQSSTTSRQNVPSNITKLCRVISRVGSDAQDPSKKFHQIVYYHGGVGTGDLSNFEQTRQADLGAGLGDAVIEAYNFIATNYEPGDEIFCFGFSRGAYTARSVAGLVSDLGVIQQHYLHLFPDLYRLYMLNDEGIDFRKTESWKWFTEGKLTKKGEELRAQGIEFDSTNLEQQAEVWEISPHGEIASEASRKVKVVGVFDTVGSLGVPDILGFSFARTRAQFGFHNVKLTEQVEHAYQALALDERRKPFRPTLWYIPKDLVDDPARPTPELKQVWFPGVHINAGGGDDDVFKASKGDADNISTATFCWMLQCISPHLSINTDAFDLYLQQYQRFVFRLRYACTTHHLSTEEKLIASLPNIPLINPAPSELDPPKRDPPHQHPNFDFSWGTGPLQDNYGGVYELTGTYTREPGHEQIEVYMPDAKEYQWKPIRTLGNTNEYIHPIVYYRYLVHGWDAHSPLRSHWKREHANGRYWWYMNDKEKFRLPEWAILPNKGDKPNFERWWYWKAEKAEKAEKATETLDRIKVADTKGRDFLEVLDKEVDLGFDKKPQNEYP